MDSRGLVRDGGESVGVELRRTDRIAYKERCEECQLLVSESSAGKVVSQVCQGSHCELRQGGQ